MTNKPIRILVVEDDPFWSAQIISILLFYIEELYGTKNNKNNSEKAPANIFIGGLQSFIDDVQARIRFEFRMTEHSEDANIIAVADTKNALNVIEQSSTLHMVTMDMDLKGSLDDLQNRQGMVLLREVSDYHPYAACLVVSGRAGENDVVKESIINYGAINVLKKGVSLQEVKNSIKATLLYAESARLKSDIGLLAAREQALIGLENIQDSSDDTFARLFNNFIREIDRLSIDDTTKLLNTEFIMEYARSILMNKERRSVGIYHIDGLGKYEDITGVHARLEALKVFSNQLNKIVEQVSDSQQAILAYLGEGKFIVFVESLYVLNHINDELQSWFKGVGHILNPKDLNDDMIGSNLILTIKYFYKENTQKITAIDQLLELENNNYSDDTNW